MSFNAEKLRPGIYGTALLLRGRYNAGSVGPAVVGRLRISRRLVARLAQLRAKGVQALGIGPRFDEAEFAEHGWRSDVERLSEDSLYGLVLFATWPGAKK